ncbi:MAG: hypothetical protein ABEK50_08840 [bacterium]
MKLKLSPTDTLADVINRYPLTVEFFVQTGYSRDRWETTLVEYSNRKDTSLTRLERQLRGHLESAVRPEIDKCESISCDPLPFCPEDLNFYPLRLFFEIIEEVLRRLRAFYTASARKVTP